MKQGGKESEEMGRWGRGGGRVRARRSGSTEIDAGPSISVARQDSRRHPAATSITRLRTTVGHTLDTARLSRVTAGTRTLDIAFSEYDIEF